MLQIIIPIHRLDLLAQNLSTYKKWKKDGARLYFILNNIKDPERQELARRLDGFNWIDSSGRRKTLGEVRDVSAGVLEQNIPWTLYVDADDKLNPDLVLLFREVLNNLVLDFRSYDILQPYKDGEHQNTIRGDSVPFTTNCFYKTKWILDYGFPHINRGFDHAYNLLLKTKGAKISNINISLAEYIPSEDSATETFKCTTKEEMRRLYEWMKIYGVSLPLLIVTKQADSGMPFIQSDILYLRVEDETIFSMS